LLWRATSGIDGPVVIHHPILLKRVELRFDPNVPEFSIHETDREPELYGSLFVDLQDIAPAAILNRKSELETSAYSARQRFIDPAVCARPALIVGIRLLIVPAAVRTGARQGDLVTPLGDRSAADLYAQQQHEQ